MIIKTKDLKKMLKEKGRKHTLNMYANRKFDMTVKQLLYAIDYKDKTDEAKRI